MVKNIETGSRVELLALERRGHELVLNVLRIAGFERWESSGDRWWKWFNDTFYSIPQSSGLDGTFYFNNVFIVNTNGLHKDTHENLSCT